MLSIHANSSNSFTIVFLQAVGMPWGGVLGSYPPTSHQDQISNSSKFNERMLGRGWGDSSKILKWVWQLDCVIILGRGTQNHPVCNGWRCPCLQQRCAKTHVVWEGGVVLTNSRITVTNKQSVMEIAVVSSSLAARPAFWPTFLQCQTCWGGVTLLRSPTPLRPHAPQ